VDLVLLLFFFLFGLSFQLWLNRMILHRTKTFAKPPDAPGGEGAPTPVPGTSAPGAAHESGEPGVRADSPASAQAGVKSVDPKAIFAAQSWRHSLIWQYCILLLFGAIELWTGVPHGQIFIDIAGWAVAFVCIDLGIMLADIITILAMRHGLRKDK